MSKGSVFCGSQNSTIRDTTSQLIMFNTFGHAHSQSFEDTMVFSCLSANPQSQWRSILYSQESILKQMKPN
ncbi:hypothetical protein AUR65_011530 [Haloferax marisrubri]|uniref:Uncharacterized protein n=1 Tax=Haloferax marisrubri TaxID=1544719 RepID=A0A2P4NPH3_9EURY|nr:hypothetical protein AUR65_011530 [Haloferax marisrubri]